MAIKMKASKEAVEEAGNAVDFEQAPPGLYVIKLAALEGGKQKDKDSDPYVEARWQIVGVGRSADPLPEDESTGKRKAYSGLFDVISLGDSSEWKRAQYAAALGKKLSANGEFSLEDNPDKPGTDIGKLALGRVKKDVDNAGNYRAKLGTIFEFSADGVDLSDAGDAPDPFATDDTEEDSGGVEYLTREGLEAMEPKDIRPILEQFDLDPTAFKGKTAIADAIDAILEAQGTVGEDADAGEDEESPF